MPSLRLENWALACKSAPSRAPIAASAMHCLGLTQQPLVCAGLYQAGTQNRYFNLRAVVGWLANSAFQSVVVFVMVMGTLTPLYADRHSGRTAGQWQTGATLFTAVIITVHLEISSVIDHWTWLHAFAVLFSVCESLPCLVEGFVTLCVSSDKLWLSASSDCYFGLLALLSRQC